MSAVEDLGTWRINLDLFCGPLALPCDRCTNAKDPGKIKVSNWFAPESSPQGSKRSSLAGAGVSTQGGRSRGKLAEPQPQGDGHGPSPSPRSPDSAFQRSVQRTEPVWRERSL